MNPEFSRASVASLIASVVRSITTFADEIDNTGHVPTAQSPEAALPASPRAAVLLAEAMEKDLDHWESHVLEKAHPWLLAEFRDLRWMLRETVQHQMPFGPSHDQPN